jgi:hypothetical protein
MVYIKWISYPLSPIGIGNIVKYIILYVLKEYVILVMVLRQNEISLPYLPYDCIFTLLHCVNSSLAAMVELMMA